MKEKTPPVEFQKNSHSEKILFIITKSNFGGAQRYVFELATRLKKNGHTVAVALGGNGALKTKLEDDGIEVFSITGAQRDISITKEVQVLWNIFSIIRTYKPTVVHLNSPKIGGLGAVAARAAYFLNRTKSGKIIYTNHGWPFSGNKLSSGFFLGLLFFLEEKL
jgi:glycosyltransferase involved in cell wall biosynthesis